MMEFGTNDAAAASPIVAAYRVAIRKSRALASDPYVWVCATYPHYANLAAGAATRDAIQNLVTTEFGNDPKVIYIDLYTPLLDPSTPGTVPNTYFGDVHTNRRGVHKAAETVLATPAVAALLAGIVRPAPLSMNDASRQLVQNGLFDTGAETNGRAAGFTSTFTTATFATAAEAGTYGKYQRITIPAGHGFFDFKPTLSTMTVERINGRRIWQRYRVRIVQRPSDVTPPTLAFPPMPSVLKDLNAFMHGDGQSTSSSAAATTLSPVMADLEDGKWYDFYSETVCDESPFQVSSIISINGNTSTTTSLIIDVAEFDWGMIDPANVVEQGLNVSYQDASGSPGNATINKMGGRAAIAAGATSVTITNNKVLPTSIVLPILEDADATATSLRVSSVANGSFVVTANAATTAATKFRFLVGS